MEVDVNSIEEIKQTNILRMFILRAIKNKPHIYKKDLFEAVKQKCTETFPNLRSDYFEMRYKNASDSIFHYTIYFCLIGLKSNYYNLVKTAGKRDETQFSLTPVGEAFLKTSAGEQQFISEKEIATFIQNNYPDIWTTSLANPANKNKKTKDSILEQETENILAQEQTINWEEMYIEHQKEIKTQILEQIVVLDPVKVEELVGDLLEKMGYGEAFKTPVTRDGGIDIILNKDRLGLDKVLVQVKRYKKESRIRAPEIRNFMGSLQDYGLKSGIFVTTSDFVKDAVELAKKHNIILINGSKLVDLMLEKRMGVLEQNNYILYSLDDRFFKRYQQEDF